MYLNLFLTNVAAGYKFIFNTSGNMFSPVAFQIPILTAEIMHANSPDEINSKCRTGMHMWRQICQSQNSRSRILESRKYGAMRETCFFYVSMYNQVSSGKNIILYDLCTSLKSNLKVKLFWERILFFCSFALGA